MKGNKQIKKEFLDFIDQVKHLKDLGLEITNESRLIKYLSKYNYENIINEFSFPFRDASGYRFLAGVTDEDIIALFNFDQSIRMTILSSIFTIEKQLTTSISYYICKNYSWMKFGEIFNIDMDKFKIIFPKIKNLNDYAKFKNELLKYCKKDKKILRVYPQCELIPMWIMCMHWSLNTTINIYEKLNKMIKKAIVSSFPKINNYKDEIGDFLSVLRMLNKARNLISHNKKIFDFRHKDFIHNIKSYIQNKQIKTNLISQRITLSNLCAIIRFMNPTNKKHKNIDPLVRITDMYKKHIEDKGVDKKINYAIKKIINI